GGLIELRQRDRIANAVIGRREGHRREGQFVLAEKIDVKLDSATREEFERQQTELDSAAIGEGTKIERDVRQPPDLIAALARAVDGRIRGLPELARPPAIAVPHQLLQPRAAADAV